MAEENRRLIAMKVLNKKQEAARETGQAQYVIQQVRACVPAAC